jgi:hypothetical protein
VCTHLVSRAGEQPVAVVVPFDACDGVLVTVDGVHALARLGVPQLYLRPVPPLVPQQGALCGTGRGLPVQFGQACIVKCFPARAARVLVDGNS